MKHNVLEKSVQLAVKRSRRRRWHRVLTCLAVVVVLCTTYALVLPGVTLEREPVCGLGEHTHTQTCYQTLSCSAGGLVVHSHGSSCFNAAGSLVCQLPEVEEHTHTEECYAAEAAHEHNDECYKTERGDLACEIPETPAHEHIADCYADAQGLLCEEKVHDHSDGCYKAAKKLTCEIPESEGHAHTDACKKETEALICGLEESDEHGHGDGCYETTTIIGCGKEESEGHSHGDGCYENVSELACGYEDAASHTHTAECIGEDTVLSCEDGGEETHTHTDACYKVKKTLICEEDTADGETEVKTKLVCKKDEVVLHTHGDGCRDAEGTLICEMDEVLEHIHNAECFVTPEAEADGEAVTYCGLTAHQHDDTTCYGVGDYSINLTGLLDEEYTIDTSAIETVIAVTGKGTDVDLLDGVKILNADGETMTEEDGIYLRVTEVTCSLWNVEAGKYDDAETVTIEDDSVLTISAENVPAKYEIAYEAYVPAQDEDAEDTQLATATHTILANEENYDGELSGDWAYIKNVSITGIVDGTAEFDTEEGAGNDVAPDNRVVRTFDTVSYTLSVQNAVREDSPYKNYKEGRLYFEFVLPVSATQAEFDTEAMRWLVSSDDWEVTATESGKQVLKGSMMWTPKDEGSYAIGNAVTEFDVFVRVLAMNNGDILKPEFTFWMEDNDVQPGEDGLVTGSTHECDSHGYEPATIQDAGIEISAAPRYNIYVVIGNSTSNQALGIYDFNTGYASTDTEKGQYMAPNRTETECNVEGRLSGFGVILQVVGKEGKGLQGCELPNGEETITFDLVLDSLFTGDDKAKTDICEALYWSIDENMKKDAQQDGRDINATTYIGNAPYNRYSPSLVYQSCFNGGQWKFTGLEGNKISIEVSGYEFDPNQLPNTDSSGTATHKDFYDRNAVKNYWDIPVACFSAGEVWVVQDFYADDPDDDTEEKQHILQITGEKSGVFNVSLMAENMVVTRNGNEVTRVQTSTEDDEAEYKTAMQRPGQIDAGLAYMKYNPSAYNDYLTEDCGYNGQDWITAGAGLSIRAYIAHSEAEGEYAGIAYDQLVKFDDDFFAPDGNVKLSTAGMGVNKHTVLFAACKDGEKGTKAGGWNHGGLAPAAPGYDNAMRTATVDDLIFYDSLDALKNDGAVCVAVLAEWRGGNPDTPDSARRPAITISGTCNAATAKSGSVYMINQDVIAWRKLAVRDQVLEFANKTDSYDLTAQDYYDYVRSDAFPTRSPSSKAWAGQKLVYDMRLEGETTEGEATVYPRPFWVRTYATSTKMQNYKKANYSEGEEDTLQTTGTYQRYGDSCLVTGYTTFITKNAAQTDNGKEKIVYSMDMGQRVVDYVLHPSILYIAGKQEDSAGATNTVTVTIQDTLPKGLTYIENSAYWVAEDAEGEEYTMTVPGQQGTVSGEGVVALESSDARVRSFSCETDNEGISTLTIVLDAEVEADTEKQHLGKIYYSCTIGDEADSSRDVKDGDTLTNTVTIHGADEVDRGYSAAIGNLDTMTITVYRGAASNLSQWRDQPVVDAYDEIGFTLNAANDGGSDRDAVVVDNLPYNGDSKGSTFDGDLIVTEIKLFDAENPSYYEENKDWLSKLKFYGTTDEAYKDMRSKVLQEAGFTDAEKFHASDDWTELGLSADGTLTLPTEDYKPTAFVAVGTIPSGQKLRMHLMIKLPDAKPRNHVYNWLSDNTLSCFSDCRVVSRVLQGRVWKDVDYSGTYEEGEELLNGIKVTLYKLEEEAYVEIAHTTTGSGYDMLAQAGTSFNKDGYYQFTNLAAGTYQVRFTTPEGSGFKLEEHLASPVDIGTDDTIDSDGEPEYDANGALTGTAITGIEMPLSQNIQSSSGTYTSANHDSGFALPFSGKLQIVKTDVSNADLLLPGAEFDLYPLSCTDTSETHTHTTDCWDVQNKKTITTDATGTVSVNGLSAGTYRLVETKAPKGYLKLAGTVEFKVDWNVFELLSADENYVQAESNGSGLTLTVANKAGTELPKAGDVGTYLYTVGGTLMLLTAAALLWYHNDPRRKKTAGAP